jgi:hypothetical protein
MKNTEYTIVGWGLAGTIMAWQLFFNKINFVVYDSTKNHSTKTAAGIVNPIVFKRLTKSWQADLLMPYAEVFYKKIEKELKHKIISPKHIYKIFSSFEDQNDWMAKQSDEHFDNYLLPINSLFKIEGIDAPFGYGEVNTFGNLDTNRFLTLSKRFFISNGVIFNDEIFDYKFVNKENDYFFCEGYDLVNNPYFNYLPLKPTHGETIIIKTNQLNFDGIINKNMFIMHIKDDLYKVGATYNWKLKEPICTEKGKEELIEKLNQVVGFDYEIVSQQAGVRPTVKDRRPLIGTHPSYNNLHVFNGLGTKGVMIAPYYSKQLTNCLLRGDELDKEINITRYAKYLS